MKDSRVAMSAESIIILISSIGRVVILLTAWGGN